MSLNPEAGAGPGRILIVDDDLPLARGLKSAFESQGYLVNAVERGSLALGVAMEFKPDLVLLDVMMPEVDGWEVLTRLRENAATARLPVIMLTASDSVGAKVKGFSLGTDDYMTKPFSLQELRCRVEAVLRRATPGKLEETAPPIPVVAGSDGFELIPVGEVYFAEGIRNYTYVHTHSARHLSRLTLGALDERRIPGFMRVHRSFIVNMDHVKGCRWASKSTYKLRLSDLEETEVPTSRSLIPEIQRRLGLRG